jgi:hypothetical protein
MEKNELFARLSVLQETLEAGLVKKSRIQVVKREIEELQKKLSPVPDESTTMIGEYEFDLEEFNAFGIRYGDDLFTTRERLYIEKHLSQLTAQGFLAVEFDDSVGDSWLKDFLLTFMPTYAYVAMVGDHRCLVVEHEAARRQEKAR